MTAHKLQVAQEMYRSGQYTVAAIATTLGVSRASIYRHLTQDRQLKRSLGRGTDVPDMWESTPGVEEAPQATYRSGRRSPQWGPLPLTDSMPLIALALLS
jgi:transposase-like protein